MNSFHAVMKENKAVKVTVQIGHTDGKMAEVLSGLEVGMPLLMHPPDSVVDGSEVVRRVVE